MNGFKTAVLENSRLYFAIQFPDEAIGPLLIDGIEGNVFRRPDGNAWLGKFLCRPCQCALTFLHVLTGADLINLCRCDRNRAKPYTGHGIARLANDDLRPFAGGLHRSDNLVFGLNHINLFANAAQHSLTLEQLLRSSYSILQTPLEIRVLFPIRNMLRYRGTYNVRNSQFLNACYSL